MSENLHTLSDFFLLIHVVLLLLDLLHTSYVGFCVYLFWEFVLPRLRSSTFYFIGATAEAFHPKSRQDHELLAIHGAWRVHWLEFA